jgi:uncharacterized membrane protein YeaQ/YmgE (transglycosylase-associated protein family)
MSFIAWILLGAIAGLVGNLVVYERHEGLLIDVALGVVGALAAGFAFQQVRAHGIVGFNPWSILVAATGATAVLFAYRTVRQRAWSDRRPPRNPQRPV